MQFRKKPVVIEAEQFIVNHSLPFIDEGVCCLGPDGWYVNTLDGPLHISNYDWIIKGTKGEFYPCKPDIFVTIYDPVTQ